MLIKIISLSSLHLWRKEIFYDNYWFVSDIEQNKFMLYNKCAAEQGKGGEASSSMPGLYRLLKELYTERKLS